MWSRRVFFERNNEKIITTKIWWKPGTGIPRQETEKGGGYQKRKVVKIPENTAKEELYLLAYATYEKCPSDLRKMPIRPMKNAHPTYENAHRPTKNAHTTFEKCPSDLRKRPIRHTEVSKWQLKVGQMHQYAVFNVPIRPTVHRTYHSC